MGGKCDPKQSKNEGVSSPKYMFGLPNGFYGPLLAAKLGSGTESDFVTRCTMMVDGMRVHICTFFSRINILLSIYMTRECGK